MNSCEECSAPCAPDFTYCYQCNNEPVDVDITGVVKENPMSIVVRLNDDPMFPRTAVLPLSQIETLAPKSVTIPRWLAAEKGLV